MSCLNMRGSYEIKTTKGYGLATTSLKIDDIAGLPDLLKELARSGLDLSATRKALEEVEEEQRIVALMTTLSEKARQRAATPRPRRFVIAVAKKDKPDAVQLSEGVVCVDGTVHVMNPNMPGSGTIDSLHDMKSFYERRGYAYYLEFID